MPRLSLVKGGVFRTWIAYDPLKPKEGLSGPPDPTRHSLIFRAYHMLGLLGVAPMCAKPTGFPVCANDAGACYSPFNIVVVNVKPGNLKAQDMTCRRVDPILTAFLAGQDGVFLCSEASGVGYL